MAESETAPDEAALVNLLIPGDGGRWPRFSEAVAMAPFLDALDVAEHEAFAAAPTDPAAWERDAPEAFALALRAVHRAYYTAPSVLAAVRTLCDESPREAEPSFDPDLVAAVVANARGKRRL